MNGRPMRPPHKGRGFVELDRRLTDLISYYARANGMRQDKFIAHCLLVTLKDEEEKLGFMYARVNDAYATGEYDNRRWGGKRFYEKQEQSKEKSALTTTSDDPLIRAAAAQGWPEDSILAARKEGWSDEKIIAELGLTLDLTKA